MAGAYSIQNANVASSPRGEGTLLSGDAGFGGNSFAFSGHLQDVPSIEQGYQSGPEF
jgi:hypothetical protein